MTSDSTAELRDMYERWFASIPAKDTSFVDRCIAPDFELIYLDGSRLDAAAYRGMYEALPDGATVEHDILEFKVRALAGGEVALVTGVYGGRIEVGGAVLKDAALRFTSVWERRPSGWMLLQHHTTPA